MVSCQFILAQQVPGKDENIPYLITFGNEAETAFGDDDFKQAFFFAIPSSHKAPFYIRIYDPGVGGKHDEEINGYNTETKFSFYGGTGIYSNAKGKNAPQISESNAGDLLFEETFDDDNDYDDLWYDIGPFNPSEGEYISTFDAFVFKIVATGITGDDGNAYRYFLSSSAKSNIAIAGANAFTFEYSVRLHNTNTETSHLYPYIDKQVLMLRQHNFDLDNTCSISIYSVKKRGEQGVTSGDNKWGHSTHKVEDSERESCIDFQIRNNVGGLAQNNNVVLYITNQYGEFMPFMAVPIGDFKYKAEAGIK